MNDLGGEENVEEGFGWCVPDQAFWKYWRADKEAMKAAGYRVTRADDGALAGFVQPEARAAATGRDRVSA